MKHKEFFFDLLAGVVVLAGVVLLSSRVTVREPRVAAAPGKAPMEIEPAAKVDKVPGKIPVAPPGEITPGIKQASFAMFENVLPDEAYKPVYTPAVKSLDRRMVKIQGFMTPYDSLENMQTFMLMGFPTGCNFCAPPSINQVVLVRQTAGQKSYPYIDKPIEVTGTMSLWHEGSEDPMHKEMFLFVLDDVQVVPLSEVSPPKGQHRRKGFLSR